MGPYNIPTETSSDESPSLELTFKLVGSYNAHILDWDGGHLATKINNYLA
jgi:hypothetical protein